MNRNIIPIGFIFVVVVSINLVLTVIAQQFTPPTPQSRVDQIDKVVNLTADQKAQILKIYTEAASSTQQERGRRGGSSEEVTTKAVVKVLTPEQVEKWHAYTLQQRIDRRIEEIDKKVTLTAEQKEIIKPVIEKEINDLNTLRVKSRTQTRADRQALRNRMAAIRNDTDKVLESILTKEQFDIYKTMPKTGMQRQKS